MSVETLLAETAASAAAEEPKVESPTTTASPEGTTTATVPPTEATPEEKQAEGEQPGEETEPDLETVPETSGDFAKYKPLFKEYPELRAILGREKAFTEMAPSFSEFREIMQRIPSVADAETLVSDAENKRVLSQTFREDVPTFVESLKESDPLAFQQLVKQFPEALAQTDETLWVEQARSYTGRVLNNAYILAHNNGNAELLAATELVARSLGIPVGQSAPTPQQNTEADKLRKQLKEREESDQQAAFESFWTQTDEAIIGAGVAEIEKTLKEKLPTATPQQIERMKKEVWTKTLETLNAQPQFNAQIQQFRANAEKGRLGIADHKAIVDFGTKRARLVIPKVAGAVISEWTKDVLRLSTQTTEKKKAIANGTKDVGAGPQGTTSSAAPVAPANGKQRGVNTILAELNSGNYVKH